ncbi:hypothetical protein [Nocardia amamiensis]|uniref:hypothetical protein n=1 Tax=Nocardia amamiensis TaxID=404578 RepID=UPI0008362FA5|nr:hypothetical protein [Nocardia amamiensis]
MTYELVNRVDCRNTDWLSSSVHAAHNAMQVHLECRVGQCPAKTVAFWMLESSGKLVRDSGRSR